MPQDLFGFLKSRAVKILTGMLVLQAALFYGTSRSEEIPSMRPLMTFPRQFAGWQMTQEGYVDEETQAVLRADDTLTRVYASKEARLPASLFIAFFKTQRTGQAPHSPKNCLPGAGWEQEAAGIIDIQVPNQPEPIRVNRFIVARGENKSVVLYWYQSRDRVIASEYRAKMYLVADAIRYNRTDTSLVRVVVPVGGNEAEAEQTAREFVQSLYPKVREHLPS